MSDKNQDSVGSTQKSAPKSSDKDWLGYDDYADSLWHRVQREFEARPVQRDARLPTGDPLVIGVYGEWGSGKTRLLELMHDKVHADALKTLGQRLTDPQAYDKELSITLPVWFHPWKYEHEAALAVPLLMHISDALRVYLKDAQTLQEAVTDALALKSTDLATWTADTKKKFNKLRKLLLGIHCVAGLSASQTAAAIAGGFIGLGEASREAVKWVSETAGKIAGVDPYDEDSAKTIQKELKDEDKPVAKPGDPPVEPRFTTDGSFYYNVHKHLRDLAVLTPEEAKKFKLPTIKHPIRLNFVVFVDDLDRCLPEKAVKTLELIKTLFNVECFAFVVALDDEVIERGIQHRYRDYRFEGVKPEMPITGFEYLEKIIHLPFRLPALTRPQAMRFIRHLEDHLTQVAGADPLPRLWFQPAQDVQRKGASGVPADALEADEEKSLRTTEPETNRANTASAEPLLNPTPLVDLLLDCFDVPAPRKLARAVESLHHIQRVLHRRCHSLSLRREWPPTAPDRSPPDAALVLAFCLLQLFAPELFRLLRRRPLIWRQWIMAYLPDVRKAGPAFSYSGGSGQLDIEVSDEALFDWAAWGNEAAERRAEGPGQQSNQSAMIAYSGDRALWMSQLANHPQIKGTRRFYTEQVRLPWARAVSGHRDVGRLAFDPLRLGAALVNITGWRNDAQVISDRDYHQLFGSGDDLLSTGAATQQFFVVPNPLVHSHAMAPTPVITGTAHVTLDAATSVATGTVTAGPSARQREVPLQVLLELIL